ncbi:MAG TPA: citrate/2-methylcitrate synthase, partial [Thermoanaerobaculia bacterium]|nr:citrate/2-methylcitrate synthase [Thermoanaerobaculia bacterium]
MVINKGLEGVVAAETALSLVDGERGELIIAGFPVAELALNATFEETVEILWGTPWIAGERGIPDSVIALL